MKYLIIIVALLSLALQGCTTEDAYTGERKVSKTAIGAGIGAGIGGILGALSGDNAKERRKRALIGAGAGGLAGGGIGYYMDRQEAALREQLRNSGVSVTREGDNITLNMPGNITFASSSSALKPQFYDTLDSVALVIKEFDQTNVRVSGHTDADGAAHINQTLSEKRAQAVSDYLAAHNVGYSRLSSLGYGEHRPIASNHTTSGKAQNRRVEIELIPAAM